MKKIFFLILALFMLTLVSCKDEEEIAAPKYDIGQPNNNAVGNDDTSFGDDISNEINAGKFETVQNPLKVSCISGTQNCYTVENGTLTFTGITEDSVYSVSGQMIGNIVIDVGAEYKFELELTGFSLISENVNPITVLNGDKVTLTAKKETQNYIYDEREAIDSETLYSASIYSLADLKVGGKGSLTVISQNNNGIHSKDDLEIKNLTLTVSCCDNALKGNDGVTIEGGKTVLISTQGDGIKTTNSGVSDKGNQKGTVTITGGEHNIYSACDGIDSAYNVEINDSGTVVNIYTDKYSNYSKEVTAVSENLNYIRFTSNSYKYSVKYYNSDTDYVWVNAEYHSAVSGNMNNYYYYSFDKLNGYSKIQYFIYTSEMESGQETEYAAKSDYFTINTSYDTFALSYRNGGLSYSWTNYTTNIQEGMGGPGGMGGMNDGNSDKGTYSTKGIKAANEITVNAGTVTVKSYDDGLHANNESTLENGNSPTGNITVNGGLVTVYSNDDGLHADGTLTVNNGNVFVINSYEGAEGCYVNIKGGSLSVNSKDDGINATTTQGTAVSVSGGNVYIYCTGDGIDSNSRTSYSGIAFSGGNTVVISNSNGNSAIDTEKGYKYTGGKVVAIMPSGGMTSEATHCSDFSSVGKSSSISLNTNSYLTVTVDKETQVVIKMPCSLNGRVIYLGSSSASISSSSENSTVLDSNGVAWCK